MESPEDERVLRLSNAFRDRLTALVGDLREETCRAREPQAKALFETAAETLLGLRKAFEEYEEKKEPVWHR